MRATLDHTSCFVIRGGGVVGTAIALALRSAGFGRCVLLELPCPTTCLREGTFAEAVNVGLRLVQGVRARQVVAEPQDVHVAAACSTVWLMDQIPVLADAAGQAVSALEPSVFIDAAGEGAAPVVHTGLASLVLGVGAHYHVGRDVHACVPVPAVPGVIFVSAPASGLFVPQVRRGQRVMAQDILGSIGGEAVHAPCAGVVLGCVGKDAFITSGRSMVCLGVECEETGALAAAAPDAQHLCTQEFFERHIKSIDNFAKKLAESVYACL